MNKGICLSTGPRRVKGGEQRLLPGRWFIGAVLKTKDE
jgi:hypothetical protein